MMPTITDRLVIRLNCYDNFYTSGANFHYLALGYTTLQAGTACIKHYYETFSSHKSIMQENMVGFNAIPQIGAQDKLRLLVFWDLNVPEKKTVVLPENKCLT